jgi:hypothetical protein
MAFVGDGASRRFVHARVLARRTADAVVLLAPNQASTDPVALSGTGIAIWDLLAVPRSVAEVSDALGSEFGMPAREIEASVDSYVDRLRAAGLIECVA